VASATAGSRHRDRGATAVEMALVLPVLLMIVFGIIDFGRMFNAQVTLTEAAREGARAAAFDQSAEDRVRDVTGDDLEVTVDDGPGCTGVATDVTVTVTHNFEFITPFAALAGMFGNRPGGTVAMTGRGVMSCAP